MTNCTHCGEKYCVDKNLICHNCGKRQISVWLTNPLMGLAVILGALLALEDLWKWLKGLLREVMKFIS